MNELIKKLQDKNYVRAFGLMKPEEQECFRKAKGNCLVYQGQTGILPLWTTGDGFNNTDTYAIKPDYQPEPEFVDIKIKENACSRAGYGKDVVWLGIFDRDCPFELPHFFTHLHCLSSMPRFREFWYQDIVTRISFTDDGIVATHKDEGKTVYARFRS